MPSPERRRKTCLHFNGFTNFHRGRTGPDYSGSWCAHWGQRHAAHFQYTSDLPVAEAVSVIGNEPNPPNRPISVSSVRVTVTSSLSWMRPGGGPPDVGVKPGAVGKRRRPAGGLRANPAGDLRLAHQLHRIGVQLLLGDVDRQHTNHQRQHQHGAHHQNAYIDIAFAGAPFQYFFHGDLL